MRLLCAALAHLLLAARAAGLDENNWALLRNVKGGVLLKNGLASSCQPALLDAQSAVISVDCLDLDNTGALSEGTTHHLYLDEGITGVSGVFEVQRVTLHPKYTPLTGVNNIAVVEFNMDGKLDWKNPISAAAGPKWPSATTFVRYSLTSANPPTWSWPPNPTRWSSAVSKCEDMSPLFKANEDTLLCTNASVPMSTMDSSMCTSPFGTVVTAPAANQVALAGVFSYIAVKDASGSLCGGSDMRGYYTALGAYLPFIKSVLKRDLNILGAPSSAPDSYSMQPADPASGTQLVTGDIYGKQGIYDPAFGDAQVIPVDAIGSGGTDVDITPPTEGADAKKALSQGALIAVILCPTIGMVLATIGIGMFIYRRRRRARTVAGQLKSEDWHEVIADDLGPESVGASAAARRRSVEDARRVFGHEILPMYEDVISFAPERTSVTNFKMEDMLKGKSVKN